MTPATSKLRKRFHAWVTKNGGEVRPRATNEFVRFVAGGELCIIDERKGCLGTMVGDETLPCWEAVEAGQHVDLRPDENTGRGLVEMSGGRAVAFATADIRAGRSEALSIRALARSTGLSVRTVVKVAHANGGRLNGFKLVGAKR